MPSARRDAGAATITTPALIYNPPFCPVDFSFEGEQMKSLPCCVSHCFYVLAVSIFGLYPGLSPSPCRSSARSSWRLAHSTTAAAASADEQRVFASYREARNQYIPQLVVGSGLGKSWGFPLSLEGSAPSILNVNSQSTIFNPSTRDFVRAAKTDWQAAAVQTKDQRNQVIQDTVLNYAELAKWEALVGHLQEEHAAAQQTEQLVDERIKEGVDSPIMRNQAHLTTARLRLRLAEAQGAIDVIRTRLSHLTGLPALRIETVSDSMPALPEVKQQDDLAGQAVAKQSGGTGCGKPRDGREFPGAGRASRNVAVGGLCGAVRFAGPIQQLRRILQDLSAQQCDDWSGASLSFPEFIAARPGRCGRRPGVEGQERCRSCPKSGFRGNPPPAALGGANVRSAGGGGS